MWFHHFNDYESFSKVGLFLFKRVRDNSLLLVMAFSPFIKEL